VLSRTRPILDCVPQIKRDHQDRLETREAGFLSLEPVKDAVIMSTALHKQVQRSQLSVRFQVFDESERSSTDESWRVDLDGTIVRPKQGRKFPFNERDWEFLNDKIVPKLREAHLAG